MVIESTADDLGPTGFDEQFGNGRINAYVAVCTARGMACMGDTNRDGLVDIVDLLALLAGWGPSSGPGDLDCDFQVNIVDLLALLAAWGSCPGSGLPEPLSLEEELADACLTLDDWDDFEECMTTGTQVERDNCKCWMEHFLYNCNRCSCTHNPGCLGSNPF